MVRSMPFGSVRYAGRPPARSRCAARRPLGFSPGRGRDFGRQIQLSELSELFFADQDDSRLRLASPTGPSPGPSERDLLVGAHSGLAAPKSRLRHGGACLGSCGACLGGCGACLGSLGLELKNVYLIQGLAHDGRLCVALVRSSRWPTLAKEAKARLRRHPERLTRSALRQNDAALEPTGTHTLQTCA